MKQNYILCASKEGYHKVAYTEWGEVNASNSAVICVHGLTRNSRDFDSLANYLSFQGHHVFCPDVVGRGESSWLKDPHHYTFKRYLMDMNVLIGRTTAGEIDWIGTSMGGIIGIMIASMPKTPIRRLILNDVGPQVPVHELWRLASNITQNPKFHSQNEAKTYLKKIHAEFGNLTEEQWDTLTTNSIIERSPGLFSLKFDPGIHELKFKWQILKELFYSPHKALEGVVFDVELWSYWEHIKCPVLVVRGKKSRLLLPEHLKRMKRTHPQVDIYEVPDAGHAPALLDFKQQKRIADWLAKPI
ncbi:MAG: alpha/beta fold hydrolase [Tatlockia sp.]|nr:alpha/beta fold hydrolase [Tatlockia sp.]